MTDNTNKDFDLFMKKKGLPTECNDIKVKKGSNVILNTDDPKLNYEIVAEQKGVEPRTPNGFDEMINVSKVDYVIDKNIPNLKYGGKITKDGELENPVEEDPQKTLSYMSVGSLEEGEEWYRHNYPKLPDQMYGLCARWNWGDLKSHSKLSAKQDVKNMKKKKTGKMEMKKGSFVVEFA